MWQNLILTVKKLLLNTNIVTHTHTNNSFAVSQKSIPLNLKMIIKHDLYGLNAHNNQSIIHTIFPLSSRIWNNNQVRPLSLSEKKLNLQL